jgi:hypothetical protein
MGFLGEASRIGDVGDAAVVTLIVSEVFGDSVPIFGMTTSK